MKIMKSGLVAAVGALLALSVSAAHADALADVKKANKVRIGIDLGLPPYGMMDDKLQPAGVDVEVARKLAKDLGVELEIVSSTGASRVPNLQTNKADLIISTLSITPERAKVIDFSVPYMPIQTIVFAPKGVKIAGMADLEGKKVATSRGTGMDTQLTREAKGANLVRYEDDATLITAAITGQADIIGGTGAHLATVVEKSPGRQMERKFVMQNFLAAVGLRKNEPELLGWVNQWVKGGLADGSLNGIYKKYLKEDLPKEILDGAR
ncbi:MAG TPA: transporter substrate-binding domain-containing protein [Lautropia sp.]|nr:transporter substrate-binding domain-containing protein [Lautropia sp.]